MQSDTVPATRTLPLMRGFRLLGNSDRMKTEKEKMLNGEPYDCSDPQLIRERLRVRELCYRLNSLSPEKFEKERKYLTEQLLGEKSDLHITPPFQCDYGTNISVGENVYFNFNCVVLDVVKVRIGDNVLFGPNVQLLTASHPTCAIPASVRFSKDCHAVARLAMTNICLSKYHRKVIVIGRPVPIDSRQI